MRHPWIVCGLAVVAACSSSDPAPVPVAASHEPSAHVARPTASSASLSDTPPGRLALSWIAAHNAGDEVSLATWIESSYAPALLERVDVGEHVAFYQSIVQDFGELSTTPIAVTESSAERLVVHLRPLAVFQPDPTTTLVVEVAVDPDDPARLARGLGLGALICEYDKPEDPEPR